MRSSAVISQFLLGKGIKPHVSSTLMEFGQKPIKFIPLHGGTAYGYEATVLSEICESILTARDNDDLPTNQKKLAIQADILIRSFAKVGIIALAVNWNRKSLIK